MGALSFGPRLSLVKKAKERLAAVKADFPRASIYGLDEFGGLGVITILKDSPETYGLPVNPKPVDITKIKAIHDTYALLDLFTFRNKMLKKAAYKLSNKMNA